MSSSIDSIEENFSNPLQEITSNEDRIPYKKFKKAQYLSTFQCIFLLCLEKKDNFSLDSWLTDKTISQSFFNNNYKIVKYCSLVVFSNSFNDTHDDWKRAGFIYKEWKMLKIEKKNSVVSTDNISFLQDHIDELESKLSLREGEIYSLESRVIQLEEKVEKLSYTQNRY